MAEIPSGSVSSAGKKRGRDDAEDDMDAHGYGARLEKRARPLSGESSLSDSFSPAQDSVLNTPKSATHTDARKLEKLWDDSDDQDSTISEHGSIQDVVMSSDDEMRDDDTVPLPQSLNPATGAMSHSPWQSLHSRIQQTHRVPTPILPQSSARLAHHPIQLHTSLKHMRHRHPQANTSNSSDLLEVPSPIDEDEVPTPPSAAEAAGSQLSMLTVSDMDMEAPEPDLPTISIDPSQALPFGERVRPSLETESAIADGYEPMESTLGVDSGLFVRKQRARSGALSSGYGSPAPGRPESELYVPKRGFSLGFRADCVKCQMRVPGHMNHFI